MQKVKIPDYVEDFYNQGGKKMSDEMSEIVEAVLIAIIIALGLVIPIVAATAGKTPKSETENRVEQLEREVHSIELHIDALEMKNVAERNGVGG